MRLISLEECFEAPLLQRILWQVRALPGLVVVFRGPVSRPREHRVVLPTAQVVVRWREVILRALYLLQGTLVVSQ